MSIGQGIGITSPLNPANFNPPEVGISFDLTTVDDTPSKICEISTNDMNAVLIEVEVVCLSNDETVIGAFIRRVLAQNNDGTLTLGLNHANHTDKNYVGLDVGFNINAQNVEVLVTGHPTKTIKWRARLARLFQIKV